MDGIPLLMKYTLPDIYQEFWEGLKRNEILGTRCKKCGRIYFPPQKDCPACMESSMEWVKLEANGEVMTYSIVKQKPQGFEKYEDYVIAIVRNSQGIDLMCWLIGGEPKVGEKVVIKSDGERILCEVKK